MILTLVSLLLAVLCFAIKELHAHSKLKWSKGDDSFWGEESWKRKYKKPLKPVSTNFVDIGWYYKLIDEKYRERWFTSTWLTVALTDGPHAAQFFMKIFLALSFAPLTGWIWAGVIWVCFGLSFTVFYKIFSR